MKLVPQCLASGTTLQNSATLTCRASDDVTKETTKFVSDFDNLTAVVGDDVATYINKTVFNG